MQQLHSKKRFCFSCFSSSSSSSSSSSQPFSLAFNASLSTWSAHKSPSYSLFIGKTWIWTKASKNRVWNLITELQKAMVWVGNLFIYTLFSIMGLFFFFWQQLYTDCLFLFSFFVFLNMDYFKATLTTSYVCSIPFVFFVLFLVFALDCFAV